MGKEGCCRFVDIVEQLDGTQARGHQQQMNAQGLEGEKTKKTKLFFLQISRNEFYAHLMDILSIK